MSVMMIGTDVSNKGGIASVVAKYFSEGLANTLSIDYYPTHRDTSKGLKILYYITQFHKILINIPRYQIVHIHVASKWSYRRKIFPLLLAKLLGKKTIIHLHGGAFDTNYLKSNFVERKIIEFLFALTDRVIVLSNNWVERIALFCDENKVSILPNCVPVAPNATNIKSIKCKPPKYILFLGRIVREKGVYDLLDAAEQIDLYSGGYKICLCGDGEAATDLRKQINLRYLNEYVEMPGWVSGPTKRTLLEKAYLFVLPSHYEALPVSVLEAMATGTPVISTPVGSLPELIQDGSNGYLIPVSSPAAIADRIRLLLSDHELWSRMSDNALSTIKRGYSMSHAEAALARIYSSLTNSYVCNH